MPVNGTACGADAEPPRMPGGPHGTGAAKVRRNRRNIVAQTHKKEEIYNGVSTSDVTSAQWGWSGMSKRSLQIAGWISVLFLLGMLFGNHPGNVENIWLVAIAALFAIGLLWHAFSPQGKQVRTVTARNKP